MINGLRILYANEEIKWHQALLRYLALVVHPGLIVNYFITLALLRSHPTNLLQILIILLPYGLLVVRLLSLLKAPSEKDDHLLLRLGAGSAGLIMLGMGALAGAIYTDGAIGSASARSLALFGGYADFALFGMLWAVALCLGSGALMASIARWLHQLPTALPSS